MIADLIYDVGLHNGADTAYYLHKGFRVVAIDANPVLTASARRFENEIAAGRLAVLNIGIAETEGTLSFWVNEANDSQSSLNETRAKRYGLCHEILVPCIPLSKVMAQHGVPYYMKVDIEGYDYVCIQALNSHDLPKYISVELESTHDLIAELHQLGYAKFKIVNQLTYTDSTSIADGEIGFRLLRKASSELAPLRQLVRRPSIASRLKNWILTASPNGLHTNSPKGVPDRSARKHAEHRTAQMKLFLALPTFGADSRPEAYLQRATGSTFMRRTEC